MIELLDNRTLMFFVWEVCVGGFVVFALWIGATKSKRYENETVQ